MLERKDTNRPDSWVHGKGEDEESVREAAITYKEAIVKASNELLRLLRMYHPDQESIKDNTYSKERSLSNIVGPINMFRKVKDE